MINCLQSLFNNNNKNIVNLHSSAAEEIFSFLFQIFELVAANDPKSNCNQGVTKTVCIDLAPMTNAGLDHSDKSNDNDDTCLLLLCDPDTQHNYWVLVLLSNSLLEVFTVI